MLPEAAGKQHVYFFPCSKLVLQPITNGFVNATLSFNRVARRLLTIPFPPEQPRGICSRCQSWGWGIRNFIAAPGAGH